MYICICMFLFSCDKATLFEVVCVLWSFGLSDGLLDGWSVMDWHRYFGRFTTTQWAEHCSDNGGSGSRWSVQEWVKYFNDNKLLYAKTIWTLLYLMLTPNAAWKLYAAQAKWKKEDFSGNGPEGGPSSSSSSSKM